MRITRKHLKKIIFESIVSLDSKRSPSEFFMRRARQFSTIPEKIKNMIDESMIFISFSEWPDKKQKKLIKDIFKAADPAAYHSKHDPDLLHFAISEGYDGQDYAINISLVDLYGTMYKGRIDYLSASASTFADGFGWIEFVSRLLLLLRIREHTPSEIKDFEEHIYSRHSDAIDKFQKTGDVDIEFLGSNDENK